MDSDELQRRIDINDSSVEIIGEYSNSHTKISCRCKLCGNEFCMIPNALLNGQRCPKCRLAKRAKARKTNHDDFVKTLYDIQPHIRIVSEYLGAHTPIDCECRIDGAKWASYPCNLLNLSAGCPVCKKSISKGERAIANYLDEHGYKYYREHSFQDCKNVFPLRFDYYLPEQRMAIEYDGEQHYFDTPMFGNNKSQFKSIKHRDEIKDSYCEKNGIRLIRIPYYCFNDIAGLLDQELNKTTQSSETGVPSIVI